VVRRGWADRGLAREGVGLKRRIRMRVMPISIMEAVEHIAKETLEQMKEERLTKDQENEESDV